MKDYRSQLKKDLFHPLYLQDSKPLEYFLSSEDFSLSNEAFFDRVVDFNRREFQINSHDDFLQILSIEALFESKFSGLIMEYKRAFDTLQWPLKKIDYMEFLKTKERPLKQYFSILKSYLWKLSTQACISIPDRYFLTEEYEGCSIADVLQISQDFQLKLDIFFVLHKLTNNSFYVKEPASPETSHYKRLYIILDFFGSKKTLPWMKIGEFAPGKVPKPNILLKDGQNYFLASKLKEGARVASLDDELEEFKKICEKDTSLEDGPLSFQYFLEAKLKCFDICLRTWEEIKFVNLFFSFPEESGGLQYVNFQLSIFFAQAILQSTKGINLKRALKEQDFISKISSNTVYFREITLMMSEISSKFSVDVLLNISQMSYSDVFTETEYRSTARFGEYESRLLELSRQILNLDYNSDKDIDTYSTHQYFICLRNHISQFAIFADRYTSVVEQKVDPAFILDLNKRFKEYFQNTFDRVVNEPSLLFSHSKYFTYFFQQIYTTAMIPKNNDNEEKIMKVFLVFFEMLIKLKCNENLSNDKIVSLEKFINSLFEAASCASGYNDVCNRLLMSGFTEELEELILNQHSICAAVALYKFLVFYYCRENKIREYAAKITKAPARYVTLCRTILVEMGCTRYDIGQYLYRILYDSVINEKDTFEKFKDYYFTRYFLLMINRASNSNYDDRIVRTPLTDELFTKFEKLAASLEKNLQIHHSIGKSAFFSALVSKDPLKKIVIHEFFKQINQSLICELSNLLVILKKDHNIACYYKSYPDIMVRILGNLYNPLNGSIFRGSFLATGINPLVNHFISIEEKFMGGKCDLLMGKFIDYAIISAEGNLPLFSISKDRQLFYQFSTRPDFLSFDLELQTEDNFDKIAQFKFFEFMLSVIKKSIKRCKNFDFGKLRKLMDDMQPLISKIEPIFNDQLNCFLKDHFSMSNQKKPISNFENLSEFLENQMLNGDISMFKTARTIKNSALLLKSFGYWRDNLNLKNDSMNFLHGLILRNYSQLEQKSEEIYQTQEGCEKLFINIMKHKLYIKIWTTYKQLRDQPQSVPALIRDQNFFNLSPRISETIQFYLSLASIDGKKTPKLRDELRLILRFFYFKHLFVNLALNDLNLLVPAAPAEKSRLDFLNELIDILPQYFETNFQIMDPDSNDEWNEYCNNFKKVKSSSYFKDISDIVSKRATSIEKLSVYDEKTCFIFFIYASATLKKLIEKSLQTDFVPPDEFLQPLFYLLSYLCPPLSGLVHSLISMLLEKLGVMLQVRELQSNRRVCGLCGIANSIQNECSVCKYFRYCTECKCCGVCKGKTDLERKCLTIVENCFSNTTKERILNLVVLLIDCYGDFNLGHLFENIFKDPSDPRNLQILKFTQLLFKSLISSSKPQSLSKVFSLYFTILHRRIQQLTFWGDASLPYQDPILFESFKTTCEFLTIFEKNRLNLLLPSRTINNLIGVLYHYVSEIPEAKRLMLDMNVIGSLIKIGYLSTSGIRNNEWEYNESLFRLLEFMSFDSEFANFNSARDIVENFVEKSAFKQKIDGDDFSKSFDNLFNQNNAGFIAVFSRICFGRISKDKKSLEIGLKEDIVKKPDLYERCRISDSSWTFLQQLGSNIINGFLSELDNYLNPNLRTNYVFRSDDLLRFLIIFRSQYPLVFELMNELSVHLSRESLEICNSMGIPLGNLTEKHSFNKLFITIIVGLGFGVYNTYLIDSECSKKLNLGYCRLNDGSLIKKEDKYFCEAIEILNQNIRLMKGMNFKQKFSSGIILLNYTNCLINLLLKINKCPLLLESGRGESLFKDSFAAFSELIMTADNETSVVFQTLEIESKMALIYKEHIKYVFNKKASGKKILPPEKYRSEWGKYYFQKHFEELLANPSQLKSQSLNCNKTESMILEKGLKVDKSGLAFNNAYAVEYKFLNRNDLSSLTTSFEKNETIFNFFLHRRHKKMNSTSSGSSLNVLFNNFQWKNNEKERRDFVDYFSKLPNENDRFRNGNAVKIFSGTSFLHEIMGKKNLVLRKPGTDNEGCAEFKNLSEFLQKLPSELMLPREEEAKEENKQEEERNNEQKTSQRRASIPALGVFDDKFNSMVGQADSIELSTRAFSKDIAKSPEKPLNNLATNLNPPDEKANICAEKFTENNTLKESEETKETKEIEEEHKTFLEPFEIQFFEKFPSFLSIDKNKYRTLTKRQRLNLLEEKYIEYVDSLRNKYGKRKDFESLKQAREELTFSQCEQYLNSEEEQYMYNELQEFKFFLASAIKAEIDMEVILREPEKDQMIENASNFLLSHKDISLKDEIPLDSVITFDISKFQGKIRYQNISKEFFNEKEVPEEFKIKSPSQFRQPPTSLDYFYEFSLFSETIDVEDSLILKIFECFCYSIPESNRLSAPIMNDYSNYQMRSNSLYFLLKILCFNYRNFIRIVQLLEHYLSAQNYSADNANTFVPLGKGIMEIAKKFENEGKFSTLVHHFIAGVLLTLIRRNYGTNFLVGEKINQPEFRALCKEFGIEQLKSFESIEKGNLIERIINAYSGDPSFSNFAFDFELIKSFMNGLLSRNLEKEQIPLQLFSNKTLIPLFPFYSFKIPDQKKLCQILIRNKENLSKSKIKNDNFFRIISQSLSIFTSLISAPLLGETVKKANSSFEELLKVLTRNKEVLKEEMKTKNLEWTNLQNCICNVNSNFETNFPNFLPNVSAFRFLCQNLLKLAKNSLNYAAKSIRLQYQKSSCSENDLSSAQRNYEECEKEVIEAVRFFMIKNSDFVTSFLTVLKIMLTVEEMMKMVPSITKNQKSNALELIIRVAPALKTYFRVLNFVEPRETDNADLKGSEYLMDDLRLPEMKRIQTKESSYPGEFDLLPQTPSILHHQESISFEEVFGLLYRVQDSLAHILLRIQNPRSPSVYNIFFKKNELSKINIFVKMEYIRKEVFYRAKKQNSYESNEYDDEPKLAIDRKNVFKSTYEGLKTLPPQHLAQYQFSIQFEGESGIDGGGLTREWITLLGAEIFNPNMGLFVLSANKLAIQPNPFSFIIPNHLLHFKFIGNMIARILMEEGSPMCVNFTKSFLKLLLSFSILFKSLFSDFKNIDKNLNINDFEDIDPSVSKSLLWMLENDITGLEQNFSYVVKFFDKTFLIDLKENGRNFLVTEENKKEYVKAFCLAKMNKEIRTQTHTLMKGILEIIPHDLMAFLNENELGVLLAGITKIDVKDMMETAILNSYQRETDVIKWLGEILEEYDDAQRASFHFFISGCFRPPFGGFKNNPISITKLSNTNKLPLAHTCSRNMELPNYSSKEILREKLAFAVFDGCSSYEFG